MEWDIGLETNFDDLMEVISPGLDEEFNNLILNGRFLIISMRCWKEYDWGQTKKCSLAASSRSYVIQLFKAAFQWENLKISVLLYFIYISKNFMDLISTGVTITSFPNIRWNDTRIWKTWNQYGLICWNCLEMWEK